MASSDPPDPPTDPDDAPHLAAELDPAEEAKARAEVARLFTPEAKWARTLRFFKRRRLFEGRDNVAKLKKLQELLWDDADQHYREADRRDRLLDDDEDVPLGARRSRLLERMDKAGLKNSLVAADAYAKVAKMEVDHPVAVDALRDYARDIAMIADEYQIHFEWATGTAAILRGESGSGRGPSGAMHYLLKEAKEQGIGDAELARRLAAEGLVPDGPGADYDDLAMQWREAFKAARYRARKRRRTNQR